VRRLLLVLVLAGAAVLAHAGLAQAAVPWCGNDQLSTDRPDAVGGRKVHVIYAIPADGADRFAEMASAITTDLAAVTDWWRREDPSHAPRWDLFPFPGCGPGPAALDLSFVRLPRGADAYFLHAVRLNAIATDLANSFDDPAKKYLVFCDGGVSQENVCGSAFGRENPMAGGRFAVGGVYLHAYPGSEGCGDLGVGGYRARTTAHELLHMLGAVPHGAPHGCPDDRAHNCDTEADIMHSGGSSSAVADYLLDPGHDDYYGHSGSWWDVQDSPWLAGSTPDRTLTVELAGARAGSGVSSQLTGIDCPQVCTIPWPDGDIVTLNERAGDSDRFRRWEGACSGPVACNVLMDGDKTVRAVFGPSTYSLAIRVSGRGRVASNVRSACRSTCRTDVFADDTATLRAIPARGWRFAGWRGCRPQAKPTCRVKMTRNVAVSATFRRLR
jgi:Divergent InlB B-repeat domain